jgi:hypothetical protein
MSEVLFLKLSSETKSERIWDKYVKEGRNRGVRDSLLDLGTNKYMGIG